MFRWLADRRRRKLTRAPFPSAWEEILQRNSAHYRVLDGDEKTRLRALVQVFVAEKNWEGAGGLEITDEVQVTVAAMACLLYLGLSHDYHRNVESIIVYPSTVLSQAIRHGFFEIVTEPVEEEAPIDGEAFEGGPVIITWDAAVECSRHPGSGGNVVFHEFAHKLDLLDGVFDGTPPLAGREEYGEWARRCSMEYARLGREAKRGRDSFLDPYGAVDEAEFFAVATEHFFDRPHILRERAPELYRLLSGFYRQDPAERAPFRA